MATPSTDLLEAASSGNESAFAKLIDPFRGELGGGIVECPTGRPVWLPYVEVPHIGAVTERARELGAAVLLEPREGPAGWRSVVAAPASGELAFWQPKRP